MSCAHVVMFVRQNALFVCCNLSSKRPFVDRHPFKMVVVSLNLTFSATKAVLSGNLFYCLLTHLFVECGCETRCLLKPPMPENVQIKARKRKCLIPVLLV